MKNQQVKANEQLPFLKGKITGRTKHYPPAIREWKNAVYSYDNNNMKHLPVKYDTATKLIKNYFSINGLKKIARSKRMRSKMIRLSTRKLFVSNPEIKQNNDKVMITIYVFNREKQFYIRKLFFYKRKSSMYNAWLLNKYAKKIKYIPGIINQHYINLKNKRNTSFTWTRRMKRHLPYNGMKFNNEIDFFRYKIKNFTKKLLYMDKLVTFSFLSLLLSIMKIKIVHPFSNDASKRIQINSILKDKPNLLLWVSCSNIQSGFKLNMLRKEYINDTSLSTIVSDNSYSNKHGHDSVLKGLLNNYLWKLIENNFINNGIMTKSNISTVYKTFMHTKYKILISKLFNKEAQLFFNYGKLYINHMKFTNLLIFLKRSVSKIYNKSTELNIVNLKYLHLSSDIFGQAVTLKLRKKRNLLKTLKRSLKLVKMPFQYLFRNGVNLNNYLEFNKFKSLNLDKLPYKSDNDVLVKSNKETQYIESVNLDSTEKDKTEEILNRIFPTKFNTVDRTNYFPQVSHNVSKKYTNINYSTNKQEHTNKMINILNSIKFKWISGLRLEVSGRLTRRNTASRSVSKLMYKGNLKNKQYFIEYGLLKSMPTIMLRNNVKINMQYMSTKSKRRIGSFGIKNWMSSY